MSHAHAATMMDDDTINVRNCAFHSQINLPANPHNDEQK